MRLLVPTLQFDFDPLCQPRWRHSGVDSDWGMNLPPTIDGITDHYDGANELKAVDPVKYLPPVRMMIWWS